MGIFDVSRAFMHLFDRPTETTSGQAEKNESSLNNKNGSSFDERITVSDPSIVRNADPEILKNTLYERIGINETLRNNPASKTVLNNELEKTIDALCSLHIIERMGSLGPSETINIIRSNYDMIVSQIKGGQFKWTISEKDGQVSFPIFSDNVHDNGAMTSNMYIKPDNQSIIIGEHKHNFYPNVNTDFHTYNAKRYNSNGIVIAQIDAYSGTLQGEKYDAFNETQILPEGEEQILN